MRRLWPIGGCRAKINPDRLYGLYSLYSSGYRGSFPGVNKPERDDHSPPPSAKPENEWSYISVFMLSKGKGKAIPLQAWTGPEGSRSLRLPDIKTIGT